MNSPTVCVQPVEVDAFLEGDLTPEELACAEAHLASCEGCRSAIELAIGPRQWWSDVQRSLSTQGSEEFSTDAFGQGACDEQRTPTSKLLELLGPSDDPAMLGRIGSYEITALLGQGGMGAVFKGFDRSLNRFVAIKVLLPHLAASGAARQRFAREGQAVAAVVDNHVMPIHSVDEWHGVPYLVMPYARGVSLQKRLSEEGPLDVREILRIGMQAARGLAAAHAQGIVHRDVKPANILLDVKAERVQLMDFGLARAVDDASLTRSGMLAGTPQYMSPEQARAEKVDQRSDLFSLGAVLYAMCTGRAPFRAESSYSVLRLITDSEPCPIREINPDIPEWLCQLIGKLMAKHAEDRYQSAEEVAKLLEACLAHVQQPTDVPLPLSLNPPLMRKPIFSLPRRSAGVIAMVAAFAAVVLAAVVSAGLAPPDIAGHWNSEDWGQVELAQKQPGEYQGTLTVTVKNENSRRDVDWTYSGIIDLKWYKLERRFNGAWKVGPANGRISLRLVDGEIRGALTTNGAPLLGTPRLGDFRWTRSVPGTVPNGQAADPLFEPPPVVPNDSQRGRMQAEDDKSSASRPSPVALVMLMHPAELEAGNSVQQAAASVALGQLSSNDFCGILKFSKDSPQTPSWLWGGEQGVVQIGNRRAVLLRSIADSDTGDFPQFDPALKLALKALTQVDASRRHMIILTNGDPDLTNDAILDEFLRAKIAISVVHIELHGPRYAATPKRLAETTGGRYYHVLNAQPSVVESIFRDESAQLKQDRPHADADREGAWEMRRYHIEHLPLWTADGKALNPILLNHWIRNKLPRSWADGTTRTQFDSGQQALTVVTSKRNHGYIESIFRGDLPQYVPAEIVDAANNPRTEAYFVGDLPIWTKDGKAQNVFLLISYLEQATDPLSWSVGKIHGSYSQEEHTLLINATDEDQRKIAGALRTLRSELAPSGTQQPSGKQQSLLTVAIREFNQTHQNHEIGRNQPPLTDDEVIASIRWAVMHDGQSAVPDPYRQSLRQIAEHRQLPPEWAFKVVTEMDGVDGERFQAWSVRLDFSGTPSVPPCHHAIRERLLWPLSADGQPIVLRQLESADDAADSKPLAAAIRGFNASHYRLAGLDMPPLTEQEVIAAIRFQKTRRDNFDITDAEFARIQRIAETRRLPADAEISVLTGYQPGDGCRYDIWSVRFSMRKQVNAVPHPRTGFTIREHFVRSQSLDLDKIAWGPVAANGLQAGVRFEPRQTQYFTGQKVAPYFCFRNTGDQKFDISFPNLASGRLVAVDNAGMAVPVDEDKNPKWIVGFIGLGEFGFGSQHEIRGRTIVLGDVERGDAEFAIRAKAGQAVRVHFALPNYGDQAGSQLQTGEITFAMAPPVSTGEMTIQGPATSTLNLQGNTTETVKRSGRFNVKVRPKKDLN